jgi:hypothetical protein
MTGQLPYKLFEQPKQKKKKPKKLNHAQSIHQLNRLYSQSLKCGQALPQF